MVPASSIIKATIILLIFFCIVDFAKSNNLKEGKPAIINKYTRLHQSLNNIQPIASVSIYVKASATGNNDGTSWQDAFTSLTVALDNATNGDTIRVATGIYVPTASSFVLKDGVVILGGYPNIGDPTDLERNFGIFQTILSGEVGNPDFPFDNLSTIVSCNLIHSGTVLDGFIIEKGFANNTLQGVGINLWRSSPQIKNCVFRNNSSYNTSLGGSAIACQNNSNPKITNCFFVNNFDFSYSTFYSKSNCNPKLINCVFAANDGRFVLYASQSTVSITNCTIFKNQIGVSYLPANVRPGFIYAESNTSLNVANTIFFDNKYISTTDTTDISLNASALNIVNSITQNYAGGSGNYVGVDPVFSDTTSVTGPDSFYFTGDDGLQLKCYSPAINTGNNAAVAGILTDLQQQPRAFGGIPDIGAYEYQSTAGEQILAIANDSVLANREYTDQNGWTHYYNDCLLLLSVKKNGQQIGTVNDGKFKVMVKTTPGYGAAIGNDLSPATYVSPGVSWTALNRYWTIEPTFQPTDSILIRFPWSGKDFADATTINPGIITQEQLVFFTVDSPYAILDLDVPSADFHPYFSNAIPTVESWKYTSVDTIQYAEFYVKKLNGGGIGTGTGLNKGPYALINNMCPGVDKIYKSTIVGSAYKWQVDTGNGFADIADNALYKGTDSATLTIIAPSTAYYGNVFRCRVTTANATAFTGSIALKFEAKWNGTVSSAWDDPANWSCGVLPDENTDVVVIPGTAFNLEVNVDVTCRSLHLLPNTIATILDGKIITITGK
jgi:hypothetical protein